jgi:hypothetical protein
MASINDLLTQATVSSRPVPTQVSTIRTAGNGTLNVLGLSGWPTGTAVHGCTYKLTTAGVKVAGSQIDFKAIVNGSNQLTSFTVRAGTDSGHAVGDIVECAPTAAYANDLQAWGSVHADSQGNLLGTAVRTALNQTAATGAGWTTLGYQPNTVTYNGNRSYTCVFNGVDLTPTISPVMRLMFQRTVAAPTTSTSLNGTTQYWSRPSASLGSTMTFTNNFVVSAWVKISAYPGVNGYGIASRYNGTSGWYLILQQSGQLQFVGFNGSAANFSFVQSYQSIPLNKWVHITAQLDMATFTATPTTSYVMIDGVDVPVNVQRSGTNPTSLVQAGNLEIGSLNGGQSPFLGKIAQVAIYSAKVTQATIAATISQTIPNGTTSLISAYDFNGNANDINTTSANNLTANGSVTATAADSPFGGQASGTISSTLDYGIIQSATFSTNTTVVVQVPDANTIPTSGGVSAVSYATSAYPYGMPSITNILGMVTVPNFVTSSAAVDSDLSGLTIPVYVPTGGHAVEFQIASLVYSTAGGDQGIFSLYEDGVIVNQFSRIADGNSYYDFISYEFTRYPTPGLHTYKVMVQRAGGAGTMRFGGEVATRPGVLKVRLAT